MATIAEERAANARARAEGYESAAHKEAHANVGASAAGYANAVQQEIDANRRAQAEGFANAAAKEMDANRRSVEAGFTSAVDQEIDANRRAREAGYLNAADYESGLRTLSDAPFVDPRTQPAPVIPEQFRIGTANSPQYNRPSPGSMHTAGPPQVPMSRLPASRPLNNAMPTFQGPDYYNQMFNRPLQNWSQFMPANSRLAGGGGVLYQNPWGYGTGGGSGWGGAFGGGGMMGGGYPGGGFIGGGGYPGGGPFPGGSWFPGGGGGGPLGPRPGSDKANDLAAGRTHHPQMYDLDDNWVGAEGGGAAEANWEGGGLSGAGAGGVPWQDTFMAPLGNRLGWDFAGYNPGQGQDTGSSYEDLEDTDIGFMQDANTGYSPTTGSRVHSGPLAYSDTSGYSFSGGPLADKQAYMGGTISPYGDPLANVNALPTVSPIFDPSTSNSWSGPYVNTGGTGDPAANVNALPTVSTYTGGATGSAYQGGGDPALSAQSAIDFQMGIENSARLAQAQAAANAAAIAAYGGGDYGLLEADPEAGGDGSAGRGSFEGMDAGYAGPR